MKFNLGDLFDRAGRLRPLGELPPEAQGEIASFEVVRITTRRSGETVTTEELIRVKTRDRRTAQVARRGTTWGTSRMLGQQPLVRRLVTTVERSAGAGATAAAACSEADPMDGADPMEGTDPMAVQRAAVECPGQELPNGLAEGAPREYP